MIAHIGYYLRLRALLRQRREDIVLILLTRFGAVSASLHRGLAGVSDIERLNALLASAAYAHSLDDFSRQLC